MNLKFSSPKTLLNRILDLAYFHEENGEPPAIPFHRVDGKSKLTVIVGDNASGKSFFRRITQLVCKKNEIECMAISAEGRRHVAYSPFLVFVYGDEETQATGVNSTNTVLTGIKTCQSRETPHVVFWDEPDLGLSDSWAAGVGEKLCEFAETTPEKTVAAFVVSHNKALVRELLPADPTYLHLGTEASQAPQTLKEWVEAPIKARNPEKLIELSHQRFQKIQHILNTIKP